MAFKKGESGNPNGRPKGKGNKVSAQVKGIIEGLLTDSTNVAKLKSEFASLGGRDMVKAYSELLPYIVPKLQNTSLDINPEDLTDEQLDYIIEKITEAANK